MLGDWNHLLTDCFFPSCIVEKWLYYYCIMQANTNFYILVNIINRMQKDQDLQTKFFREYQIHIQCHCKLTPIILQICFDIWNRDKYYFMNKLNLGYFLIINKHNLWIVFNLKIKIHPCKCTIQTRFMRLSLFPCIQIMQCSLVCQKRS